MRPIIFFTLFLCCSTQALSQETRYIRDTLYVPLRSDQSPQSEIVRSSLVSGTALSLIRLSNDENYSYVRTQDGIEGWIQTQYLTDTPAAKDVLQGITTELESTTSERNTLRQKLTTLEADFSTSESALQQALEQALLNKTGLEELQSISSNSIQLDANNKDLLLSNMQLNNQVQVLDSEVQRLQESQSSTKFWNGALAVLLGVFITLIIPRLWPSKRTEWS